MPNSMASSLATQPLGEISSEASGTSGQAAGGASPSSAASLNSSCRMS